MAFRRGVFTESGFTLVELLATVTLLGVLAGTLYYGFISVLGLYGRSVETAEVHRASYRFSEMIGRDVANAFLFIGAGGAGDSGAVMMRTYELAHDSSGNAYGRAADVTYRFDESDTATHVLLRIAEYLDSEIDTAELLLPPNYFASLVMLTQDVAVDRSPLGSDDRLVRSDYARFSLTILRREGEGDSSSVAFERSFASSRRGAGDAD